MCWKIITGLFKKEKPEFISPAGFIDIYTASSILLDILEGMGDGGAEIYLPDAGIKKYAKDAVINCCELEEVSAIKYATDIHDCDDFAAELYGKFAGLAWTNVHALNFFFDDRETFWWIEPQNKKISRCLEGWQGNDVRFFLAR